MSTSPFEFLLPFTVAAALSMTALVGCGNADESEGDEVTQQTGDELTACNAGSNTAYQGGRNLGVIRLMDVDDNLASIKTGHAYLKLKQQMAARGVTLSINSGFRTMDEQKYFYDCYQTQGCNDGNKAAKPGYSNHQHGRALDLQISNHTKFKNALRALGLTGRWKNTVVGERWHWEYFGTDPGGICDADSAQPTVETPRGALDTDAVAAEGDQEEIADEDVVDYSDVNIDDDVTTNDGEVQTADAG